MYFYTSPLLFMLDLHLPLSMNQCWPPLQVLCLWPQLNLGLGVGPKSYFHVDNLFLTLPLLNFIRYFSHFHFSLPHLIYIYTLLLFLSSVYLSELRVKLLSVISNFPKKFPCNKILSSPMVSRTFLTYHLHCCRPI